MPGMLPAFGGVSPVAERVTPLFHRPAPSRAARGPANIGVPAVQAEAWCETGTPARFRPRRLVTMRTITRSVGIVLTGAIATRHRAHGSPIPD